MDQSTMWHDPLGIPPELFSMIIVRLEPKHRFRASQVCKSWQTAILSDHTLWSSLNLDDYPCPIIAKKAWRLAKGTLTTFHADRYARAWSNRDILHQRWTRDMLSFVLASPRLQHVHFGSTLYDFVDIWLASGTSKIIETLSLDFRVRGASSHSFNTALSVLLSFSKLKSLKLAGFSPWVHGNLPINWPAAEKLVRLDHLMLSSEFDRFYHRAGTYEFTTLGFALNYLALPELQKAAPNLTVLDLFSVDLRCEPEFPSVSLDFTNFDKLKTLRISSRAWFPLPGLPRTLQTLSITNEIHVAGLKTADLGRITPLPHLKGLTINIDAHLPQNLSSFWRKMLQVSGCHLTHLNLVPIRLSDLGHSASAQMLHSRDRSGVSLLLQELSENRQLNKLANLTVTTGIAWTGQYFSDADSNDVANILCKTCPNEIRRLRWIGCGGLNREVAVGMIAKLKNLEELTFLGDYNHFGHVAGVASRLGINVSGSVKRFRRQTSSVSFAM